MTQDSATKPYCLYATWAADRPRDLQVAPGYWQPVDTILCGLPAEWISGEGLYLCHEHGQQVVREMPLKAAEELNLRLITPPEEQEPALS